MRSIDQKDPEAPEDGATSLPNIQNIFDTKHPSSLLRLIMQTSGTGQNFAQAVAAMHRQYAQPVQPVRSQVVAQTPTLSATTSSNTAETQQPTPQHSQLPPQPPPLTSSISGGTTPPIAEASPPAVCDASTTVTTPTTAGDAACL